jgi:branched-chain amino acid aminotransferase
MSTDVTIELAPSTSPRSEQERARLLADPGFGQVFTDP